tara:strand:+ start:362 stop:1273 length:912 start_codon:yes stop_codon:yes gene_type:complete
MSLLGNKLLIIGGTGFIGSYLCEEGLKKGMHVTSLSINSKGTNKNINYINADITNSLNLIDKLSKLNFDYVINCGGYIKHNPYFHGGNLVIKEHLIGLYNIIDSLDLSSLKRFIQIGSSDEYGLISAPQKEDDLCFPTSSYSYSKLSATNLLQSLGKYENFKSTIVRIFLVYGPKQKENRLLPYIIKNFLNRKRINLSPGKQIRDFCFISDIVNGIFKCIETNKDIDGEVFNLSSADPITVKELVSKVANLTNTELPKFGNLDYKVNESMELWGSNDKARKILNWTPKVSIDEGLQKTIDSYK